MLRACTILTVAIVLCLCCLSACVTNEPSNDTKTITNKTDNLTPMPEEDTGTLHSGRWRAFLQLDETTKLPFNFEVVPSEQSLYIINGDERIEIKDITYENNADISIKLPYFNSEIRGKYTHKRIVGKWYNYAKGENYSIPIYATQGDSSRFYTGVVDEIPQVAGRWEVVFMSDDKKHKTDAIATFSQEGTKVYGTFLTPTGDYRYLEGDVSETELMLSCFDGAHAFLFTAEIGQHDDMKGHFYSGSHWHETWLAFRNDTITLPDPNTLTKLNNPDDKISFSFPNLLGEEVSLNNDDYDDKVVMIQIMGSWCPNCLDESRLYADLYGQYHEQGLEIIALAYEMSPDLARSAPILNRYIKQLNIPYTVLLAGEASKQKASESLPMLNKIISFPTTIFIDRQGKVRKIHTGFSGPATTNYAEFVQDTKAFIEGLLSEQL